MTTKKPYGTIYDKRGNLVNISAPISATGKEFKKHTKTMFGKLGANVGFSMNLSGKK